jgi:hypothetical protein
MTTTPAPVGCSGVQCEFNEECRPDDGGPQFPGKCARKQNVDTTTSGTDTVPTDSIDVPLIAGVASVLLVGCIAVAAFLLWRLKRVKKSRVDDVALQPDGDYIEHAAEFKFEEGPHYESMPSAEARNRSRSRKTKPDPKTSDADIDPGQSGRSAKEPDRDLTSARAETWAIEIDDLELGSVIGQGAFGVVRRAQWRGRTVAVKQIKKSTIGDGKAVADFEEEIGRMAALQSHENVVRLFGVVELANGDVGAVVEYCAQGALVDALYGEKVRDFSPDELLQIAYDAACGVMHLHANKIVHRDIAARNVLLAGKKDLVAKVSDFGMARDVEGVESGAEQQTKASIGPIRWMAPEQLERLAYSKASDVFAFGVLLYEIFARSAPWPRVANVNVITQVITGKRMELPMSVPAGVRKVIGQCWVHASNERPSMQLVVADIAAVCKNEQGE